MKRILTLLLLVSSFMMMGQVTKTSGVLYTSGNPKTNKVVSLIRKSLSKNSEIVVDQSTGDLYTYKRTDSTFVQATRPYKVYMTERKTHSSLFQRGWDVSDTLTLA